MIERTRAWRRKQTRHIIVKIRQTHEWVKAQIAEGKEAKLRREPARQLRLQSQTATDLVDDA